MPRFSVFPVLFALFGFPCFSAGAWEMSGSKAVVAHMADGARIHLGSIAFMPKANGAVDFNVSLDPTAFSDHFLSMREFKCVQASAELTCHVPYPYPNPKSVTRADLAWLEHSVLFFYKRPSEFGAKLWNGIYFEFKETETGLVVNRQDVVSEVRKPGHRLEATDPAVRAMPVVVMLPAGQGVGAMRRVLIGLAVSPLAQG